MRSVRGTLGTTGLETLGPPRRMHRTCLPFHNRLSHFFQLMSVRLVLEDCEFFWAFFFVRAFHSFRTGAPYVLRLSFVLHGKRILQTQNIDAPLCNKQRSFLTKTLGCNFCHDTERSLWGMGIGRQGGSQPCSIHDHVGFGSLWSREQRRKPPLIGRWIGPPFTGTERPLRIYL